MGKAERPAMGNVGAAQMGPDLDGGGTPQSALATVGDSARAHDEPLMKTASAHSDSSYRIRAMEALIQR